MLLVVTGIQCREVWSCLFGPVAYIPGGSLTITTGPLMHPCPKKKKNCTKGMFVTAPCVYVHGVYNVFMEMGYFLTLITIKGSKFSQAIR